MLDLQEQVRAWGKKWQKRTEKALRRAEHELVSKAVRWRDSGDIRPEICAAVLTILQQGTANWGEHMPLDGHELWFINMAYRLVLESQEFEELIPNEALRRSRDRALATNKMRRG